MSDFLSLMIQRSKEDASAKVTAGTTEIDENQDFDFHPVDADIGAFDPVRAKHLEVIIWSRLFDPDYYLRCYADIAEAGLDPLEHFFDAGY